MQIQCTCRSIIFPVADREFTSADNSEREPCYIKRANDTAEGCEHLTNGIGVSRVLRIRIRDKIFCLVLRGGKSVRSKKVEREVIFWIVATITSKNLILRAWRKIKNAEETNECNTSWWTWSNGGKKRRSLFHLTSLYETKVLLCRVTMLLGYTKTPLCGMFEINQKMPFFLWESVTKCILGKVLICTETTLLENPTTHMWRITTPHFPLHQA